MTMIKTFDDIEIGIEGIKSEREVISQANTGRTTICIPLGPVAQQTIITKNTGVPRAGGVNNFATAEFIPIPDTTVYVISKYCAFYVTAYDEQKNHVADYNQEDNVHGFGQIEIDNSQGGMAYIKIGFWTGAGYSADRYAAAEVLYYTDLVQKSGGFIASQKLGPCSMGTTGNISSINNSDVRIGPVSFVKAEKNIGILRDGNESNEWRYLLFEGKDADENLSSATAVYYADWNKTTAAAYGTTIPKGCYYWLGYAYGNNVVTNVDTVIQEAHKHIHVRELEDGEPYYYGFDSAFDVASVARSRVGVADKLFADTDLFLVAQDGYVFSAKLYKDGDWWSSAWTASYSVGYMYVPKGSWYRYNVGRSDGSAIDEQEIKTVYGQVKVFKCGTAPSDIDKFVIGLQTELSVLRRRVSYLEQSEVPSYYTEHISEKAALINQRKAASNTVAQFAFITDVHVNGYGSTGGNAMHSKSLINYLMQNTAVRNVFNGGDLLNTGTGMSEAATLDVIQQAISYTQPDHCGGRHYFVMGNHDTGVDYIDDVQYGPSITAEQLYRAGGNDAKRPNIVFDPISDANYYFDEGGVRYIVSDLGIDTYTGETIGQTYLFISKAVESANCPIVILQHVLWNNPSEDPSTRPYRLGVLQSIVDACNSRGVSTYGDSSDYQVDYSESTSTVCCIVGGHLHQDRYSYTDGGVPIIAVTTDNWGAEYELSTTGRANASGTVDEQAFDVFTVDIDNKKVYATRIGYGSDREFTFPETA